MLLEDAGVMVQGQSGRSGGGISDTLLRGQWHLNIRSEGHGVD